MSMEDANWEGNRIFVIECYSVKDCAYTIGCRFSVLVCVCVCVCVRKIS